METVPELDLEQAFRELKEKLGREPTEEEFIIYLMHPKDALEFFDFFEKYGKASYILPTPVFRYGLRKPGDKVEFTYLGKPYTIELVSVGAEHDGVIHVVVKVNNKTRVFEVVTPRIKKKEVRMAKGPNEIGSPIKGNVWRLGNPKRGDLKVGDIYHKGEEIANLEAMKMETPVYAPFDCVIEEICVKVNESVVEGQLLFIVRPLEEYTPKETPLNLGEEVRD